MKNILILVLLGSFSQLYAKNFISLNIEGWTVHVEKSEYKNEELKQQLHQLFGSSLINIKKVLPQDRVKQLQKITIWISSEDYPFRAGEKSSVVYHIDPNWLEANKLDRKYAPAVHMINPKHYLLESKPFLTQPMVILHELTHGYLHQCLGGSHPKLTLAYNYALASTKYEKIKRVNTPGEVRAYALNTEYEYFSELTEAYYGQNDYFPFNRNELKEFDPIGYKMVQTLWESKCEI